MEREAANDNNRNEEFNTWLSRAREKTDWYDPLIERKVKWFDGFNQDNLENSQNSDSQWKKYNY